MSPWTWVKFPRNMGHNLCRFIKGREPGFKSLEMEFNLKFVYLSLLIHFYILWIGNCKTQIEIIISINNRKNRQENQNDSFNVLRLTAVVSDMDVTKFFLYSICFVININTNGFIAALSWNIHLLNGQWHEKCLPAWFLSCNNPISHSLKYLQLCQNIHLIR